MARKSQNRSVNASQRSFRLVEREEPGDASTRPPPSTEGASHGLLIQLAQQVQNLTTAIQDLRQPANHRPSVKEHVLPSQHSRRSRPDLRSKKCASHSRSGQRATRPQQDRGHEKRPRSCSSEEFSTSDSSQSVHQHRLKEYKEKLRDLDQQVAELRRDAQRPIEGLRIRTHPSCVRRITQEPISVRFRMP